MYKDRQPIARLTKKQHRFYETLKRYMATKRRSPTIAEIMRFMKLASPRSVSQYLTTLERKGLITRTRYETRGIALRDADAIETVKTVTIPVLASAGCDNVAVFAEQTFGEFICVASELLQGKKKERIVSVKATGDSMVDAGVQDGDYVLVEITQAVADGDLVVAIVDGFAVIKKLEFANNAVILRPVSPDPAYKPIIANRDFRVFGKVVDIIRVPQRGDLEIVPLCVDY